MGKRKQLASNERKIRYLCLSGQKILINGCFAEGSSCLCYKATSSENNSTQHDRILKEFYPIIYEKEDSNREITDSTIIFNGDRLYCAKNISENIKENVLLKRTLFKKSYEIQSKLERISDLGKHIVHSIFLYEPDQNQAEQGEITCIAVFTDEKMDHLNDWKFKTCREKLDVIIELCRILDLMHKKGYLYIDVKPENVLYNGVVIKLSDFGSAIDLSSFADPAELANALVLSPNGKAYKLNRDRRYIDASIDTYGIGLTLFEILFDIAPSSKEFEPKYYGEKNVEEIMALLKKWYPNETNDFEKRKRFAEVIANAIRTWEPDESRKPVYQTPNDLAEALNKIMLDEFLEPDIYWSEDFGIQAAMMIDEDRLYKYREVGDKEDYILKLGIIGDYDKIAFNVFKALLSSVHMLNTKLEIYWAVMDPNDKVERLNDAMPGLFKCMDVEVEGEKSDKYKFDERAGYVTKSFGVLKLDKAYTGRIGASWVKDDRVQPRWIVIASQVYWMNIQYYNGLQRIFERFKPSFEYCIRYSTRKEYMPETNSDMIIVKRYAAMDDEKYEKSFYLFKNRMIRLARKVDRAYGKPLGKKAKIDNLDKIQIGVELNDMSEHIKLLAYDYTSSFFSALSIMYKLVSMGIWGPNDSDDRLEEALAKYCENLEENRNKLIYLEHYRWTAFMLAEGWKRLPIEQMGELCFKGDNDQRDRIAKLHAILASSTLSSRIQDDNWGKDIPEDLDNLDKSSLALHKVANDRSENLKKKLSASECPFDIAKGMSSIYADALKKWNEKCMDVTKDTTVKTKFTMWNQATPLTHRFDMDIDELKKIALGCIENIPGINSIWEYEYNRFMKTLKTVLPKEDGNSNALYEHMVQVGKLMKPVLERNMQHDYKNSDEDIINALPLIMTRKPITDVVTFVSEDLWKSVMVVLLVEPKNVYLVDSENRDNAQKIKKYLEEIFGEGVLNIEMVSEFDHNILVQKQDGIYCYDLTALDDKKKESYFYSELPCTWYEKGVFDYKYCKQIRYYSIKPRMTPRLSLDDILKLQEVTAKYVDQELPNKMIGNYEIIWNCAIGHNRREWEAFCEINAALERNLNRFNLTLVNEDSRQIRDDSDNPFNRDLNPWQVEMIEQLFNDLRKHNLISYQDDELSHGCKIKNKGIDSECLKKLCKWIYKKISYNEPHVFSLQHDDEGVYVIDTTLMNRGEGLMIKEPIGFSQGCIAEFLRSMLKELSEMGNGVSSQSKVITQADYDTYGIEASEKTFDVEYEYVNDSTKSCLMVPDSALESYVYHTIRRHFDVDDLKMNMVFTYKNKCENTNEEIEVDIVFAKNSRTYFVDCFMGNLLLNDIERLHYIASKIGIDCTAIMVSGYYADEKYDDMISKECKEKAELLHVSIIRADHLQECLKKIIIE